jgi:hypothetical protein
VPLLVWLPGRRRALVLFLLPALLPYLGWCAFNQVRFDTFAPTALAGLGLTNKTGAYMQDAPSRFATVRDIYVAARAAHHGRTIDLIWRIDGALMRRTGQTLPRLSRTFMSIDIYLITHHPVRYAGNVAHAIADFWKGWGYHPWLAVAVLSTCLACALVEYGANGRFGLPTEPLVFVVAATLLAGIAEDRGSRANSQGPRSQP